jgi:hypothetical protein
MMSDLVGKDLISSENCHPFPRLALDGTMCHYAMGVLVSPSYHKSVANLQHIQNNM